LHGEIAGFCRLCFGHAIDVMQQFWHATAVMRCCFNPASLINGRYEQGIIAGVAQLGTAQAWNRVSPASLFPKGFPGPNPGTGVTKQQRVELVHGPRTSIGEVLVSGHRRRTKIGK